MGGAVEERTYPPVGGQVRAANCLVRPIGTGGPRRFVELDREPHLARDRQTRPFAAGEPFGGAPVALRVSPEVLIVEAPHGHRPAG